MRILFVIHQFRPEFAAGTEAVTLSLAKSAQAAGHHVEVLTASVREADFWASESAGLRIAMVEGVRVSAIPMHDASPLITLGFRRDERIARATRHFLDGRAAFDVVHVTHSMRMLEVVEVLAQRGLPYVVTVTDFFLPCYRITLVRVSGELCQGPEGGTQCLNSCPIPELDEDVVYGRLARTRAALRSAVSVNTCSDYVGEVLRREYPELRVRVVPHGIDLRAFDDCVGRTVAPAAVFGYLGTISAAKGVHVLVDGFLAGAPADARLELIGPCFDPVFMQQLIRSIGADKRIAIRAPIEAHERAATLSGLSVLCLPSLWPETFSLVIHEGFAASVPCLVSDYGAPAQTVRRFGCGEVVEGSDYAGWSSAVARTAASPALVQSWRENIPLPIRIEEEAFIYDQLYRQAILSNVPFAL